MTKPRIAIVGGGPVGIEAAIYARQLGFPVVVYERGEGSAAHVRSWGFVRLFTPWRMNASQLGLACLRSVGRSLPDPSAHPLGRELVEQYLQPLTESLGDAFVDRTEVSGIGKFGLTKGQNIAGRRRASSPFRLLLKTPDGETEASADVVLDTSGVYGTPAVMGDGGVFAVGERAFYEQRGEDSSASSPVSYQCVDVLGAARDAFRGRRTLVVGDGFSAATAVVDLAKLCEEAPDTQFVWSRKSSGPDPLPRYPGDPLEARAALAAAANHIAAEPASQATLLTGVAVRGVERVGGRLKVLFRPVDGGSVRESETVDRILVHCGFRPNIDLYRELQVHQCYASEGPMQLAVSLLKTGGGVGGDCLTQSSHGAESLKNPEPGFFILGHKSYGRRNDFLLRLGWEQIRDVFRLLTGDGDLDLYRSEEKNRRE